jgi:hypothetical protein
MTDSRAERPTAVFHWHAARSDVRFLASPSRAAQAAGLMPAGRMSALQGDVALPAPLRGSGHSAARNAAAAKWVSRRSGPISGS